MLNETNEEQQQQQQQQRHIIDRSVLNETSLKERYSFDEHYKLDEDELFQNTKNYLKKHYRPTRTCMKLYLCGRFPILKWILKYDIKHDILKDLVAGLTVGIIQIAPTMANSMMANLPPINGLYVAFFAVMTYFFMGTCRHLSLGTHGVISLMIGKTIEKYEGVLYAPFSSSLHFSSNNNNTVDNLNMINDNSSYLSNNIDEAKVMIANSLGFLTVIIHVINLKILFL